MKKISSNIFSMFSVWFWTEISAETERWNDTETETEMHTETEISAETETETEIFRSLFKFNIKCQISITNKITRIQIVKIKIISILANVRSGWVREG